MWSWDSISKLLVLSCSLEVAAVMAATFLMGVSFKPVRRLIRDAPV
jgi:hypothetical protein